MERNKFNFTDRYKILGIPYPDKNTMCNGKCEGIGFYPHKSCYNYMFIDQPNEEEIIEQSRWDKEHKKAILKSFGLHWFLCDGWHFIKCPICNGTGKKICQKN